MCGALSISTTDPTYELLTATASCGQTFSSSTAAPVTSYWMLMSRNYLESWMCGIKIPQTTEEAAHRSHLPVPRYVVVVRLRVDDGGRHAQKQHTDETFSCLGKVVLRLRVTGGHATREASARIPRNPARSCERRRCAWGGRIVRIATPNLLAATNAISMINPSGTK